MTAAERAHPLMTWGACFLLANSLAIPALAQSVVPTTAEVWPSQIVAKEPTAQEFATEKGDLPIPMDCPDCDEPLCGCLSSLSVGARAWFSWGNSDSNFRVGSANVASDRHWRDMVAETGEINVGALFWHKFIVCATVGGGTLSSGQLTDQDFATSGSQSLISQSISPAGNHGLQFYNCDLGWRFCECTCFFFDGLIGYQYWRERYVALGGPKFIRRQDSMCRLWAPLTRQGRAFPSNTPGKDFGLAVKPLCRFRLALPSNRRSSSCP